MLLPSRTLSLAGAVLGSGALVLLSATPGVAATTVARASAVGLVLTVASTPTDSGAYKVTNDGKSQTATGSNKPTVNALGNQSFVQAGTLAQDATTSVKDGRGSSAACAGLAGDGASLAAAGSGSCLTPGKNLALNAGTLDLSKLTLVQADVLGGLDQQLQAALQPLLNAVVPAVQGALQTVLTSAGNPDISLDIGAIQSQCTAGPATADGDSQLTDAALSTTIAGTKINLVSFPTHPAPNTKVVTNLDKVVTALSDALKEQLKTGLNGVLAPAGPLAGQLLKAINDNVVKALEAQLAPLEKNVLDGTLNKQSRTPGAIAVTALDLRVLPAASAFGVDLLSTQIGAVTCGPSGRVVVAPPPPTKTPQKPPAKVPTAIPSGLESAPAADAGDHTTGIAAGALAALALLAGAVGVGSFRRGATRP